MAINFPNSPINGETYSVNDIVYQYDTSIGAWIIQAGGLTSVNVSGPIITETLNVTTALITAGTMNVVPTIIQAFDKANTALSNTSGVSFNGSLNFPSGNVTLSSGRLFVTSTGPLTPFGAYGAGGSFTWDFNGTGESYLDANTIYFRSGNPGNDERMRIDSSGNVIIRGSDATVQLGLGTWGSDAYIGTVTGDAMFLRTSGTNRMRIGSTGGTTFYGSNEILVDATSANFTMTSSGGTGRSWMMISSTGGTLSFYDSTASNTRMLLSSSGGTYLYSANGSTTHDFDYTNLGARLTLRDDTGTSATRLEEQINATRLLQLIDGSDMYIGFGSSTVATGNLMFMRPGYNEAARIDATGNLLVGRTNSTVGQRVKVDINGAINASAILVNGAPFTSGSVVNVAIDIVDATRYITFANGTSGTQATSNVSTGLKFNPSSNTLTVDGSLFAVTKSFVIDHPTKPDMKLRYGSLEGPENGIYVRGKLDGQSVIELPDYWWNLIDPNSITVNLTPCGRAQELWVQSVSAYKINLNQPAECFFTVFAERKDVEKLVVEY